LKNVLNWKRFLDFCLWTALSGVVIFAVSHHEPWTDEAQSWLLARDLNWIQLVFGELRYEGHPGLWYSILWVTIHIFHLPYSALGYVGASFAILGFAVVILLAPFPLVLRYSIVCSYFFVYQYAVIARSYVLLPLLAFGAASLFRHRPRWTLALALVLSLLGHVSVHGAVIALGIALAYGMWVWPRWPELESPDRRRTAVSGSIFCAALILLVIVLYPPQTETVALSDAQTFTAREHLLKSVLVVFVALNRWPLLGALFFAPIALWLSYRPSGLLLSFVGAGGVALIYGFCRGTRHHEGIIIIALLTAIWSVWPSEPELRNSTREFLNLHKILVWSLTILFMWQTYLASVALRRDWYEPYTGAKDAATYLKSMQTDLANCAGYTVGLVAIQPYFSHNIFVNLGGSEAPGFYHQSVTFENTVAGMDAFAHRSTNPPCVVMSYSVDEKIINRSVKQIEAQGYRLVHTSTGTAFFENEPGEPQLYMIFVRRPS